MKYKINIYSPEQQGSGAFDGGKITEIKPIDFPGGTSQAKRIGPLFYWAWASANGDGVIGMHPHQGFEIMSYVLRGELGHTDSMSGSRRVGTGGVQLMQTGSGISHQEEMFGERTDFFQIWFEPDLNEAVNRQPTYRDFKHKDFPVSKIDGVSIKKIIGEDAPISLVADAKMEDIIIQPGVTYRRNLASGLCLAVVAISGEGTWQNNEGHLNFKAKDFSVIEALEDTLVTAQSTGQDELLLAVVEVPTEVGYPLYGWEWFTPT